MIDPKLLASTSLKLLEEAVLSVLYRESDLKPNEISKRLGIGEDYSFRNQEGDRSGALYPIVRSLIGKLEREKRVKRDRPKNAKWSLTESEREKRTKLLS